MLRLLLLVSLLGLVSCSSIEKKLDEYTLVRDDMDKVLQNTAAVVYALDTAFTVADANADGEVRGLEWIAFVKEAIARFKEAQPGGVE